VHHRFSQHTVLWRHKQYSVLDGDYLGVLVVVYDVVSLVNVVEMRCCKDPGLVYLTLKSFTTSVKFMLFDSWCHKPGVNWTGLYPKGTIYLTNSS